MKSSFFIGSVGPVTLGPLSPNVADPTAVLNDFLNSTRGYPLLLRNEAARIDRVQAPSAVAPLQKELSVELRAYADDFDTMLAAVRSGAWRDERAFAPRRKHFEDQFALHARRIAALVAAFKKRGYVISNKPSD